MPHDPKCESARFVREWNHKVESTSSSTENLITEQELQHMLTRQFGCYCKARTLTSNYFVTFKMLQETGENILEWVRLFRAHQEEGSRIQASYDSQPLAKVISVDFLNRVRLPD